MMEKEESFVVDEEQSPQSNQTWPMDMIKQRRFQHKMSSLLSPVTTPKSFSSNAKSLLNKYSKSDPITRKRFPVTCSDEGVLMDGVLVTSASEKKFSDSPSSRLSSLGRSPSSSLVRSQHKKNSSPKSLSGINQEDTTRSQTSSGVKVKILATSPCTKLETPKEDTTRSQTSSSGGKVKILATSPWTKLETPKAAAPSNLNAAAEPFTLTPRPSQGLPSPLPVQQLPFNHGPRIQWVNPQLRPSYGLYLPPSYTYPRSLQVPDLYHPHYPSKSPARNDSTIISLLPTTPLSTNTNKPPLHTPISTIPTTNLNTSDTAQDSKTVTQKQDLSSPAAELETATQKPDVSPSAGVGLETVTTEKDWSPSDDGLPRFTQALTDFMKSQDRFLPDGAFQHYIYRKRLPIFTQLCLDDTVGPALQTRPLLSL